MAKKSLFQNTIAIFVVDLYALHTSIRWPPIYYNFPNWVWIKPLSMQYLVHITTATLPWQQCKVESPILIFTVNRNKRVIISRIWWPTLILGVSWIYWLVKLWFSWHLWCFCDRYRYRMISYLFKNFGLLWASSTQFRLRLILINWLFGIRDVFLFFNQFQTTIRGNFVCV